MEYKAILMFKKINCMRCYALLSDESLFMQVSLTSLYINMIIVVVDYYSSLTYEHLVFG